MIKLDHARRRIMRRFRLDEISAVDNPAQAHARMKILKREDTDMPWTAADAEGHTKKADTPEKRAKWAKIANAALEDKGDEGYAIRVANAAIAKMADETEPYWKREFSEEQRREAADSGAAEPDGSYPIKNAGDLHNAMRAIGRSKNPAKTKAHIRARARALGLEHELSDAFKRNDVVTKIVDAFWGGRLGKARDALMKSLRSIVDDDDETVDKAELIDRTVDEFTAHIAELSADLTKALSGGDPDAPEEIEMSLELKKALGLPENATAEQITAAVTKLTGAAEKAKDDEIAKLRKESADLKAALVKAEMTEEERAHHDKLEDEDDKKKFRNAEHAERREMMRKRDRDPELLELAKAVAEKEALAKRVAQLEEDKALAEFTKEAVDAGLPESEGKTWMLMAKNAKTPEEKAAVAKLKTHLKSAIAAAKEGGLFKEFGATGRTEELTPYDELVAKAAELRKIDPKLTEAQAFAKVYQDPANKKLAQRERQEKFSGSNAAA
jgi:hypothetical protein